MDSSVDDKNMRQKFFRVQNRVERFKGDCLLNTINWRDTTHFDSESEKNTGCRVTNNSAIQYYVHPDDHTQPKYYYYCDTGKSKL